MAMLWALLCLALVVLLLWAEYRDHARLRWIAKPAASAAFVIAALGAGALDSAYGIWVLAALVLCLAGDVLLIPAAKGAFLAGMGAFALGHAAYIGAFLTGAPAPGTPFYLGAAGMIVFAAVSIRWLWPHLGDFRGPVAGYTAIISVMVAASFLAPSGTIAVIGAAIFAISDLTVARDRFIKSEFINRQIGLPLYYGAQLLLANSVSA